ncbi:MAG: glycosyltransferase family 4 protein [Bacteroidetes bacterium]|nr:glycosyltransferase family 4 protein [Bacteroidota bacterium]
MKKALIITYYWPPSGGAGVQRWLKFVKYLRGFGWEPIVYTPENPEFPEIDNSLYNDIPDNITVIKTPIREPYNAYKRLIGQKKEERINPSFLSEKKRNPLLENISVWIRGNFFIPDARMFWIRPSVRFLLSYLEENPVDIIISTGPPHSMHIIGMNISKVLNLPWIADFRDPWTNIDFYKELRLTCLADHRHRKMELQVLSRASAVTCIGDSMAEDFNKLFTRKYDVITNGYDGDDISQNETPAPDRKFSISYIGTMVSSRNPVSFWTAIQSLVNENKDFRDDLLIRLVGKTDYSVMDSINQSGLTGYVEKVDYLPHRDVIKIQRQTQVLLLIINDTPNAKMILTGKFFEYMAARRPILCIGPIDGDASKILAETNSGMIAGFSNAQRVKEIIQVYYSKFKAGTLFSESTNIEAYSRKALTEKLSKIMDSLV